MQQVAILGSIVLALVELRLASLNHFLSDTGQVVPILACCLGVMWLRLLFICWGLTLVQLMAIIWLLTTGGACEFVIVI